MVEVMIPLIVFASLFGMVYVFLSTRNKERMALIEKGADASLFESKKTGRSNLTLKFGMLAVGIGIGILIASILESYTILDEEVAYPSMIFLFGGLFLVANAIIEKKDVDEQES